MEISEKLKQLRSEKKITQKMLAKNIGVALAVIGDIESNRRPPSKTTAMKLAEYTGTSIDYWINENETERYVKTRSKFSSMEEVIKKLKETGHMVNGVPDELGWKLLNEGLSIDLKFMELNEIEK